MKVTTQPVSERSVTLEATMDELVVLYDATRKGRRNREQEKALLDFGDLLRASDGNLASILDAAADAGTE